ncbi:MAG TPA: hypothetical protein PLZ16_04740, partial [Gammaproteobacteria bacterium]|nr:hypothetical protein [Gammaproteobacteria bacterium]
VIDIGTPTSPVIVGSVDTPGNTYGVTVVDGYAYVADGSSGLQVIDIGTPTSPVIVGSVYTPGYTDGVAVADGYAYVADGEGGLQIISAAIPSGTTWLNSTSLQLEVPTHLYPGTYDVTIVNPDGTIYKAYNALTIR